MKTYLQSRLPCWTLVCLLGCWSALAGATQVLAPEVATPAPLGSGGQNLSLIADGRFILSWVEQAKVGKKKTVSRLRFTVRKAGGWTTPRTVVTVPHNLLGAPFVLDLGDETFGAAWLVYADGLAIYLSRSTDGGKHWSEPFRPYAVSKAKIGDGQMSLAAFPDGRVALVWIDYRHKGAAQLRGIVVDWQGRDAAGMLLDSDVCSCCKVAIVIDDNTLWTAYWDHLEGNVRDISLIHWSTAGPAKSAIVHNDHWVIDGCLVNGPAIDRRAGLTMVSWFRMADNTGQVVIAFSHEGVGHFGEPIVVDKNANGHVQALLLEDGSALVAWRDRAGPVEKLQLAQVRQEDIVHGPVTVYHGGFPRWSNLSLTQAGDSVYVAWTTAKPQRVRLVKVPLAEVTAPAETVAKAE